MAPWTHLKLRVLVVNKSQIYTRIDLFNTQHNKNECAKAEFLCLIMCLVYNNNLVASLQVGLGRQCSIFYTRCGLSP